MSEMLTVQICKSCLKASVFFDKSTAVTYAEFAADVEDKLNLQDSQNKWEAELGPCIDICPENRISLAISALPESQKVDLTTSDQPTVESVVQKCLQIISDKSK